MLVSSVVMGKYSEGTLLGCSRTSMNIYPAVEGIDDYYNNKYKPYYEKD